MRNESPFPPKTDLFTKHGAGLLAEYITAYWHGRGYKNVFAEPYPLRGDGAWGVKSNLWQGLPRGRKKVSVTDPAIAAANRAVSKIAPC